VVTCVVSRNDIRGFVGICIISSIFALQTGIFSRPFFKSISQFFMWREI
jgi:hypothetical protein